MNVIQKLSFRQLFNLKAKTLEQRITNFYHETQNSSVTIKYILALKVRCQLGAAEFDHFLKDLVREVFMHTKATRTMKRLFYYFEDYFMAPEWKTLKLRVFPVKKFGEKIVSVARSLMSFVRPDETSEP
ncbi:hypothetical protein [Enterococcus avium]|uniref:hypothetical protein n=1 Tax=Enterococcus avium TaxID=33945 RepID=UPI00210C822C|nr:hypothetical protein [Enterococcus avium]MCQ4675383.1 hypothetical protein [Enterococcus avium]